jgi:predicted deacylase
MTAPRLGDLEVAPGSRGQRRVEVARLADGYDLSLPVHVLRGAHEGPTLLVVGVVHGEEIFAVEAIRQALDRVELTELRGTVLAVPVANPLALAAQTRNTPLDMLDLNRQFPGDGNGWLSQRLAAALAELVERSDCLVHIDGGTLDRVIRYVFVKGGSGSPDDVNERLSRAFGLDLLYRGPHMPGSLTSFAAERGVPAVLAEVGGALLYADPRHLERVTTGVFNIMRSLEMLPGVAEVPSGQRLVTRRTMLRVPAGGIFHPRVGIEVLGQELAEGTLLGTVVDPYGLEEIAQLRAPYARSVLFQMRVLPSAVQPGDYAYIIGDLGSAEAA